MVKKFLLFLPVLGLSLFIYSRYFTNLTFGDEYDNFTYSWLTKNGVLPYRDFFTHHYPGLIFLGTPLEFFGHSQIIYRWFVLFITFAFFSFFYFYLSGFLKYAMLIFMLFSSFAIGMYSGQQFADGTFWAISILGAFFIVMKKKGDPLSRLEILLFSVFLWIVLFSSPIHVLPFIFLIAFHLSHQRKRFSKNMARNIGNLMNLGIFLAVPIALFLIYLLVTNSFWDFYFDTIVFNNQFFYLRVYEPFIGFKPLDFYLHTTSDVINHFVQLFAREGSALIIFIKAAKFIFWPFAVSDYPNYLRIIFHDLYNTFLSFEIFIAFFYLLGIGALLLKREFKLAIFCIVFIFGLRMRLLERIHMAPYYLFSYFLISTALVIYFVNIWKKKYLPVASLGLIFSLGILTLFIVKNWYEFGQIAYNRFEKKNQQAVDFLTKDYRDSRRILVVADESASYYYDTRRMPYGRFINYFEWYDWSDKLSAEWLSGLTTYNDQFLVVDRKKWETYCFGDGAFDKWLEVTFDQIRENFLDWHQTLKTKFFVGRKQYEEKIKCPNQTT